jgi:hypothetical protein
MSNTAEDTYKDWASAITATPLKPKTKLVLLVLSDMTLSPIAKRHITLLDLAASCSLFQRIVIDHLRIALTSGYFRAAHPLMRAAAAILIPDSACRRMS